MLGCVGHDLRPLQPEGFHVLQESLREGCGEFLDRPSRCLGTSDDLVVDIGDVHDVGQIEALVDQIAAEQVLEGEGAKISDVDEVVYRGAAGIHAEFSALQRDHFLSFLGQSVVESQSHGGIRILSERSGAIKAVQGVATMRWAGNRSQVASRRSQVDRNWCLDLSAVRGSVTQAASRPALAVLRPAT